MKTARVRRRFTAATAPDDAGTTARADPLVLCVAADDASAGVAVSTYAASDDELTAELRPDSKSRFRRRNSDLISTACW